MPANLTYFPDVHVYVFQCGHSREPVLFEDNDYLACRRWLAEAAR